MGRLLAAGHEGARTPTAPTSGWRTSRRHRCRPSRPSPTARRPDNTLACPLMDKLSKGSCASLHANEPDAYFKTIKFWKTPLAQCDNGQERLRPVPAVGHGLDPDHRLAGGRVRC